MGALAHHPGGPLDLRPRGAGIELQGARMHAEQRQPVAEYVVHLAGDLLPRLHPGPLGT